MVTLKRISLGVLFKIVRTWVVLCPGLQRTMMMAGESAIEARDMPLETATGVIKVWPRVTEQIETSKIIISFELDFISLSIHCRRKRDGAVDEPGWRGSRNHYIEPMLAARAAGHGLRQGLRRGPQSGPIDANRIRTILISARYAYVDPGEGRTPRTIDP